MGDGRRPRNREHRSTSASSLFDDVDFDDSAENVDSNLLKVPDRGRSNTTDSAPRRRQSSAGTDSVKILRSRRWVTRCCVVGYTIVFLCIVSLATFFTKKFRPEWANEIYRFFTRDPEKFVIEPYYLRNRPPVVRPWESYITEPTVSKGGNTNFTGNIFSMPLLPVADGWGPAGTVKMKLRNAVTTFVTAYFPSAIELSETSYEERIKNALSLQDPMVIFTRSEHKDRVKELRGPERMKYTVILTTTLEESFVTKLFPRKFWEEQVQRDPESGINMTFSSYWIRTEKWSFLKQVIDHNPFETDYFLWGDIGAFHNTYFNDKLLVKDSKPFEDFPQSIVVLNEHPFLASELTGNRPKDYTSCDACDHLDGSFIGGTRCGLERWFLAYYDILLEFGRANKFINGHNSLLNDLCLRKPYLCAISPSLRRKGVEQRDTIKYLLHGEAPETKVYRLETSYSDFAKYHFMFNRPDQFVSVVNLGRLGNQLFGIASTLGIAHQARMSACLPDFIRKLLPRNLFKDPHLPDCPCGNQFHAEDENGYAKYHSPFQYLSNRLERNHTQYLVGEYGQSFKYFANPEVEAIILKKFSLVDYFAKEADRLLEAVFPGKRKTTVAIHIRGGDKTKATQFLQPTENYFRSALNMFREMYRQDARFVVVSEASGLRWIPTIEAFKSSDVHIFGSGSMERDFALLVRSLGGTISTTGSSFSWWASYLGPRKNFVYEYKEMKMSHSIQKDKFFAEDYYLPWSIGIDA